MKRGVGAALVLILATVCFLRNGVWENDATLWMNTATKSPPKTRGNNEVGIYYLSKHNYERALATFITLIRTNPYEPNAYVNLGLAYEGLGMTDMAAQAYNRAITIKPDDPTAYYNLGCLYYNTRKDHRKALELFLKARDLNPLEPDVHQYLGDIYREAGRPDLAQEEYRLNARLK